MLRLHNIFFYDSKKKHWIVNATSLLVKKEPQSSDSAIANFLASIHCDLNVPSRDHL